MARSANVWPMADGGGDGGTWPPLNIVLPESTTIAAEVGNLYFIADGAAESFVFPADPSPNDQLGMMYYGQPGDLILDGNGHGVATQWEGLETPTTTYNYPAAILVWQYADIGPGFWALVDFRYVEGSPPVPSGNGVSSGFVVDRAASFDAAVQLPAGVEGQRFGLSYGGTSHVVTADGTETIQDPFTGLAQASLDTSSWPTSGGAGWYASWVYTSPTWKLETWVQPSIPVIEHAGAPETFSLLPGRIHAVSSAGHTAEWPATADVPVGARVALLLYEPVTVDVDATSGVASDWGSALVTSQNVTAGAFREWTHMGAGVWDQTAHRVLGCVTTPRIDTASTAALEAEIHHLIASDDAYTLPEGIPGMCIGVIASGDLSVCTLAPLGSDAVVDPTTGADAASIDLAAWRQNTSCTWKFLGGRWYVVAWYEAPTPP